MSEHHHEHEHEHCHHEHEHHEHDHQHEHHEHEHHHHDHDHGHHHHDHDHHDHDHGQTWEVQGYKLVETHNHEGATICSFEKDVRMEKEEARAVMETAINDLEAWLDETGALIGHVKGYIKESSSVVTFSTTGNGLNVEDHAGGGLSVGFAAIVFGPEAEVLKDKVIEVFSKL